MFSIHATYKNLSFSKHEAREKNIRVREARKISTEAQLCEKENINFIIIFGHTFLQYYYKTYLLISNSKFYLMRFDSVSMLFFC